MFYSRKPRRNWIGITSAMLGGLLLGASYKKYGSTVKNKINNLSNRNSRYEEDYTDNMEPDA